MDIVKKLMQHLERAEGTGKSEFYDTIKFQQIGLLIPFVVSRIHNKHATDIFLLVLSF